MGRKKKVVPIAGPKKKKEKKGKALPTVEAPAFRDVSRPPR